MANVSNSCTRYRKKDSSVKKFSSCKLKFPEKNNRQCMENLLQTKGQIQGQVQP